MEINVWCYIVIIDIELR